MKNVFQLLILAPNVIKKKHNSKQNQLTVELNQLKVLFTETIAKVSIDLRSLSEVDTISALKSIPTKKKNHSGKPLFFFL